MIRILAAAAAGAFVATVVVLHLTWWRSHA